MKKLILFLCFAFAANAFAQKDSLIVLNNDVSIVWGCCTGLFEHTESYLADVTLLIKLDKNATFKTFSTATRVVKSSQLICNNSPHIGEQLYFITRLSPYRKNDKEPIRPPVTYRLFLKYTKKAKIYIVEIPLNKLPITRSKHPDGNSVKMNGKSK